MRTRTAALLALAGLLTVPASAATTHTKTTTKTTEHTLSGTIESYDAMAHTLNVKTSNGSETFTTTDAKAWSGSKSVSLDQLSSDVGAKVKVTYADKEGRKNATAIHVTPPATKSAH